MTAELPATPHPAAAAESGRRFEVRSITGARYTIVEELDGVGSPSYRTAHARLPVVANDDGSFTIVDTRTRLVRIDAGR